MPRKPRPPRARGLVVALLDWMGVGDKGVRDYQVTLGTEAAPAAPQSYDWSDTNLPWAYDTTDDFTEHWPGGVTVVPIQTGAADFYTNLSNTVAAAGQRVVVELGEGVYRLNSFRLIGSSGDPKYAFGFWFRNLQGLLGQGPDKTFIQMDANSLSQAQLDSMAVMTRAAFAQLQTGLCRIDGVSGSPALVAGLTFRAADQQEFTSTATDMQDIYWPQPAPHQGVMFYDSKFGAIVSHVRFQGAGRAITSAPPFELANASSQYESIAYYNCEFDGRRSPALDPAQPRRCGPIMFNNATSATMTDCWLHHSNVSRYAANDQNAETAGAYSLTRCKLEQITNTRNTDPALNGGDSLGGWTDASCCGWESTNATITLTDCILSQDNPLYSGQIPMHLQLTSVGGRNPQGGRLYVYGGEFRNDSGFPTVDGFVCFRIQQTTYWALDGYDTTLYVQHPDGQELASYYYTATWPPTAAALAAAGVTPQTHYIVRGA